MAYTPFGEFVRILRIKHHQVMGDMAKVLGASTPFLSAVENGKKNVPADWIQKLVVHYGLNSDEKKELETAIEESRLQYKIIPGNAGLNQRKVALQGPLMKWMMKRHLRFWNFSEIRRVMTNGLQDKAYKQEGSSKLFKDCS